VKQLMKYIWLLLVFPGFYAVAAGADVHGQTVGYVYQIDFSDSIKFDVNIPARAHSCGSTLYRSSSPSDAVANRKFTLALTAFTADKKISFRETGECEGNRMKISWIRITN